MAASDVKAGEAYVKISTQRGELNKGLSEAAKRVKAWATSINRIGLGIMAGGTAVVGGLSAAVSSFASSGSAINDLSARTGIATDKLSGLQYAASQASASAESMNSALDSMAKFSAAAAMGSAKADKMLKGLGLDTQKFLALKPEDRFLAIADALSAIGDDQVRGGIAAKIFGGSGKDLGPLLSQGAAGIRKLQQEAAGLGLTVRPQDAQAADALGDAFGRLQSVLSQIVFTVGASFATVVMPVIDGLTNAAASALKFVDSNRELAVTLGAVALGAVAVGAALVGIAGVGFGIAAIGAGLATAGTAIAAMLSPAGLALALLAAVGATLVTLVARTQLFSDSMRAVWQAMSGGDLQTAWEIVKQTAVTVWAHMIAVMRAGWFNFLATMVDGFIAAMSQIAKLAPQLGIDKAINAASKASAGFRKAGEAGIGPVLEEYKKLEALKRKAAAGDKSALPELAAAVIPKIDLSALRSIMGKGGKDGGLISGAAGTFSGFGAAMLNRSAPANERTADAAEEMNDKMDDQIDLLEEIAGKITGAVFA